MSSNIKVGLLRGDFKGHALTHVIRTSRLSRSCVQPYTFFEVFWPKGSNCFAALSAIMYDFVRFNTTNIKSRDLSKSCVLCSGCQPRCDFNTKMRLQSQDPSRSTHRARLAWCHPARCIQEGINRHSSYPNVLYNLWERSSGAASCKNLCRKLQPISGRGRHCWHWTQLLVAPLLHQSPHGGHAGPCWRRCAQLTSPKSWCNKSRYCRPSAQPKLWMLQWLNLDNVLASCSKCWSSMLCREEIQFSLMKCQRHASEWSASQRLNERNCTNLSEQR